MNNNSTYKQIIDYKWSTVIEEYKHSSNNTSNLFESKQCLKINLFNQLIKQGY